MKKLNILLFIVAVATTACKKPINIQPDLPSKDVLTSSRFYFLDGSFYEQFYTYDVAGNLMRDEDRTSAGALMSSREYYYTSGRLIDVILNSATAKVAQYHYSYDGDKVSRMVYQEYKNGVIKNVFEHKYEFEGDCLKKLTVNYFEGFGSHHIMYEWEGKNIRSQKKYLLPQNVLDEETVYEYDNSVNPLYRIGSPVVGNTRYNSANNVTRISTFRVSSGQTEDIFIDFEYDDARRPVKQYNRFGDGRKLHEQSYSY